MPHLRHSAAIALVAASSLIYEILLTRVAALRLAFHYSFLMVAGALMAIGLSGALLYALRERLRGQEEAWLRRLAWTYALSLPLTYGFLLLYPAPHDVKLIGGTHLLRFSAYVAGAAVPFLFCGGVIGLILLLHAKRQEGMLVINEVCKEIYLRRNQRIETVSLIQLI